MPKPTKWQTETAAGHSQWYIERFRKMALDGADLAGEARFVDAMLARGSRVLDAGCGPGRVGAELSARGHTVVGVDADPELIAAAIADHQGPTWHTIDLCDFSLRSLSEHDVEAHGDAAEPFDAIVVAGNVVAFMADGTQQLALSNLRESLAADGFIVVGFGTDRGYSIEAFDEDSAQAGLALEHRFGTWHLGIWEGDCDFAVSVLRVAGS